MLLRIILILCQRKHRLSRYLETRGTLSQLIIVGSLPMPPEFCIIIVANMDDKFFLQTSPDTYYTYEPPLVFRAYRPLISVCCLYCYNRGTLPLPLGPLPPCRIRSFFFNTLCLHNTLPCVALCSLHSLPSVPSGSFLRVFLTDT